MSKLNKTDHGLITISDPGADKPLREIKTVQCVHCGGHWIPQPGSGRMRGWCQNCNGFVCGPQCAECVHVEQMLDNIENGRPLNYKPIIASVPLNFE
jgi:hypothetical protein